MARARYAAGAAYSSLRSYSYVAIDSDSSGLEMVAGTIARVRCVECTVDALSLQTAAIPSCRNLTRMLSVSQCKRPEILISTMFSVSKDEEGIPDTDFRKYI